MEQDKIYHAGLDIGSTTVKLVLADSTGRLIFSRYKRHCARIMETVAGFFHRCWRIREMASCICL